MIQKNKAIYGLRGILFLSVFIFHYYLITQLAEVPILKNGFYAVDSFFVLSGFLITTSLIERYNKSKLFSGFFSFLKSRFLRLYGAFLFLFYCEFIAIIFIGKINPKTFFNEFIFGSTNLYNWWLIVRNIPYFEKATERLINLHFWSLSIEWQFYLLWGISIGLIFKFFRNKSIFLIQLISIIFFFFSLILNLFFLLKIKNFDFAYYSCFTRFSPFMLGATLSVLYRRYGNLKYNSFILDCIGAFCLVILIFIFSDFYLFQNLYFPANSFFVSIFSVGVLLSSLKGNFMKLLLGTEVLSFIGKISYSGYLLNYPLIYFSSIIFGNNYVNGYLEMFLLIIMNLSLATFSYLLFEEPYLKKEIYKKTELIKRINKALLNLAFVFFCFIILLSISNYKLTIDDYKNDRIVISKTKIKNIKHSYFSSSKDSKKELFKKVNLLLIGDSFAGGAAYVLKKEIPTITIDTKVSRQFSDIREVIQRYNIDNFDAIIVALGTNGYIFKNDMQWLIDYCAKKNDIVFCNYTCLTNLEKSS